MQTILSTTNQLAQTKAKIGSELWYCSVTGEPEITRVSMQELKVQACYDLAHGLGGDPDTAVKTVYVGKGAHRAARRALRKEEARLGVK